MQGLLFCLSTVTVAIWLNGHEHGCTRRIETFYHYITVATSQEFRLSNSALPTVAQDLDAFLLRVRKLLMLKMVVAFDYHSAAPSIKMMMKETNRNTAPRASFAQSRQV